MVVDISEITLDNIHEYQIGYRKKRKPRGINAKGKGKGKGTFDIKEYRKSKEYKKYQHNYYLRVTKLKRQKNKILKLGGLI